eukprot:Sro551_g164830.2  (179) ;mRNA; f:19048-19584
MHLFVVHAKDYTSPTFPWMVLAIKGLAAFLMEASFLPSFVLATVTVSETKATWDNADDTSEHQPLPDYDDAGQHQTNSNEQEDNPTSRTTPAIKASTSTNLMYGSLVSCIEFGDQIGAILATPLVTALNITRENNWHNLDVMIELCSGIGVLSAGMFVLLLCYLPPAAQSSPQRPQEV